MTHAVHSCGILDDGKMEDLDTEVWELEPGKPVEW